MTLSNACAHGVAGEPTAVRRIRGASCTISGTTLGLSCAVLTSDTKVLATSRTFDICAGSCPCSTHDLKSCARRSRSAPRRISVSWVGPMPTRTMESELGMLAAPRVLDLVERGFARSVGSDAGAWAADVVARCDQHHAVLGQVW